MTNWCFSYTAIVVKSPHEAARRTTPTCSKTIAAQRLSSTLLLQRTRRWRPGYILVPTGGAPLTSVVQWKGDKAMKLKLWIACLSLSCAAVLSGEPKGGLADMALFPSDLGGQWGRGIQYLFDPKANPPELF